MYALIHESERKVCEETEVRRKDYHNEALPVRLPAVMSPNLIVRGYMSSPLRSRFNMLVSLIAENES